MKRRKCLFAGVAWAAGARATPMPPAIAFDESSPPTMYRLPGQLAGRGIYPALVGAAFALMGRPCELRALPFRRLLAEVDGGQALAGAVIRTPERERRWRFSQPYFLERLAVFSAGLPYRGPADLVGRRVGVIRGWAYGEAFDGARRRGEFQCEEVSADVHNFAKLLRGRLDHVVATEMGGRMLLRTPAFAGRIVEGSTPLGATPIHLALGRDLDDGDRLLVAFDTACERLRRAGGIEAVVNREVAAAAELAQAGGSQGRAAPGGSGLIA